MKLNIHIGRFVHTSMRSLQIQAAAFAIVGIHLFIDLIMCIKPIFIKNEHFFLPEHERENFSSFNKVIHPMINKLKNIKNMKYNFQDFQQPLILTNINFFSCTSSAFALSFIERIFLISITGVHFAKSSLPFQISSQWHHMIFEHAYDEFFMFSSFFFTLLIFQFFHF